MELSFDAEGRIGAALIHLEIDLMCCGPYAFEVVQTARAEGR